MVSGIVQVADIGDVRANLYNLTAMADEVTKQYEEIFRYNIQVKIRRYSGENHDHAGFVIVFILLKCFLERTVLCHKTSFIAQVSQIKECKKTLFKIQA